MNDIVTIASHGSVALVTVDNPPVNALSHRVRGPLMQAFATLDADSSIQAIVLAFAGKTFSVGADVAELGAAPIAPSMGEVMRAIDAVRPILVAAIQGQALGGGLETALLCDYRIATSDARFGMPEIKLGLIPGGGGTQRLPRLIGIEPAIDMIVSGKPIDARTALANGLIDAVADGDLVEAAIALARRYADSVGGQRRLSGLDLDGEGYDFAARRAAAVKATRLEAAGRAIDAVEAATRSPFADGITREAALFQQCRESEESAALRYLFAAERDVARVPGAGTPRPIRSTAVVGAGTMGTGVGLALLDAGFHVTLIENQQQALDRGIAVMTAGFDRLVGTGRLTEAARDERLARLTPALDLQSAVGADLVIECVFEDMAVKQQLFATLGRMLGPQAVMATNTSALDVNAIAEASGRPSDVVGIHFFSPANIMRLVEVIDARDTDPDVLATAMAVARRMGKIGVVSGVCDGFIGNRMIGAYLKQANLLLLEGASPEQVDAALVGFGMAMGPHAMGDMAGLDIQAAARIRRKTEGKIGADEIFGAVGDRLVAEGRLGLKAGRGLYRYEQGSRRPLPDPLVAAIVAEEAARLGIARRSFDDDEIVARCILPLINEGARIIEEGIALGSPDIDVVYCNGYGYPRRHGGPMFTADRMGLPSLVSRIEAFAATVSPRDWQVAPLLSRLARDGQNFSDMKRGKARDRV